MAEPSSSQDNPCDEKAEDSELEGKPETLPHQEVKCLFLVVKTVVRVIAVHSDDNYLHFGTKQKSHDLFLKSFHKAHFWQKYFQCLKKYAHLSV